MTDEVTPTTPTETPKKSKAPALRYESTTLSTPKKVDHLPSPVRTGGFGGGNQAADILAAFQAIEPSRGDWFLVAEKVANPGRFYDGLRGHGATVKVNRNGTTTAWKGDEQIEVPAYDVYAMVEPGDLKPWKKGKSGKQKAQEAMQEKGTAPAGTQERAAAPKK